MLFRKSLVAVGEHRHQLSLDVLSPKTFKAQILCSLRFVIHNSQDLGLYLMPFKDLFLCNFRVSWLTKYDICTGPQMIAVPQMIPKLDRK